MQARWGGFVALVALTSALGCGRTMSQSDCERIGDRMREIWDAETKATAPDSSDERTSDLARLVLKNHRERVGNEWMSQCRRELEGRRVDQKEIDCILKAKTIAEIQACSTGSQ